MKRNPLGNTALQVSRLSMGASSLGGVFREVDEAAAIRAVHTALDCGINYFDVAPAVAEIAFLDLGFVKVASERQTAGSDNRISCSPLSCFHFGHSARLPKGHA